MPTRLERGFIWIPKDKNTNWSLTVNGLDIKNYLISAKLSFGLISEELNCEIEIDNSGEDFNTSFSEDDEIILTLDFSDGTTRQFAGVVNEIRDKLDNSYSLIINGSHYTSYALDILVNKSYSSSGISTIRADLISTYLGSYGFTSTNIETNNELVTITFNEKPLIDCLLELDKLGDEDSYFDNDKDYHSFKRGSKDNDNEAIIFDDTLISLEGLGSDNAEKKNNIKVYGEAGGLPVLYTTEDTSSRTKQRVITDTSILDEDDAASFSQAELDSSNNPPIQGNAYCFLMPELVPGYMTYIVSPPRVHNRYRIAKYTFLLPSEQMNVIISSERSIAKLFKDRIKKDLAQETLSNPHNMKYSVGLIMFLVPNLS